MGSRHPNNHNDAENIENTANHNDCNSFEQEMIKHKFMIQSTWNKLKENKERVGLSIYQSIVYANTLKGNGQSISTPIIFENTDIRQQSLRFMNMLDTVISSLEEPKVLILKLHKLAKRHSIAYHVKRQNYMDFKHGFMKAIKRELQPQWMQYENAWKWFWNFMISIMSPDIQQNEDEDPEDITILPIDFNYNYTINNKINDDKNNNDIIDIDDYFIELNNVLYDALKIINIPEEIVNIITLFSLNLTTFCENIDTELIEIDCYDEMGNGHCTATRISNKHYSWCCASVMSKYWITNKTRSPLTDYYHQIVVKIEDNNNNKLHGNNDNIEICIGFTSEIIKHHLQGANGFGDLECGFAVRCWDKRLIHNGTPISKYTLSDKYNTDDIDICDDIDISQILQKRLQQRLHEGMKINDELTFIIDMDVHHGNNSSIQILLNGQKQNNHELIFKNIPNRIAFCTSLWSIGMTVRIHSWTLIKKP